MNRPTAKIGRDLSSTSGSSQRDNTSENSNNGTSVSSLPGLMMLLGLLMVIELLWQVLELEKQVCLGIIPGKVQAKNNKEIIETYGHALPGNGSQVTLCHEQLISKLEMGRGRLSLAFTAITGSTQVESHVVNLTVMSMDESMVVDLLSVRTVSQMPISRSCNPRKGDLARWSHDH